MNFLFLHKINPLGFVHCTGKLALLVLFVLSFILGAPQMAKAKAQSEDKPAEGKTVYLTFDDGPSKYTSQVLDILVKENVKATFFVLGEQAKSRPDLIKRIVKEGHQLGNHSYNHNYKELYSDFRTFWQQIQKTEQILNEIVGERPSMIRAPGGTFGNFDQTYFDYLEQAGYSLYDWHVDSNDSKRRNVPASEIINSVKRGSLKKELIVLMHDGGGHAETVKALPSIIKFYKANGYQFAPITTQVKPYHFPVARKFKWHRPVISAEAVQKMMRASQASSPDSSAPLQGSKPAVPLMLKLRGSVKLQFKQEEYMTQDNHVYVQLRSLVNRLGGSVSWHQGRQSAAVSYGPMTAFINPKTKSASVSYGNREEGRTAVPVRLQMVDGKIHIAIRDVLALFNYKVKDYSENQHRFEVTALQV